MKNTKIEWTESTWNPLRGCSRVSEGCRNCYAETVAGRFSGPGQPYEGLVTKTAKGSTWNGEIKLVPEKLAEPLRWQKPRMIFVNSMSDLFHENVPDEYIDRVFAVMALASKHTFQVLTKRPERMQSYLSSIQERAQDIAAAAMYVNPGRIWDDPDMIWDVVANDISGGPLSNVWLGVSVENQKTADERIPLLLETPAAVRWISAEPLLGPVDIQVYMPNPLWNNLPSWKQPELDWVVVGGESGSNARPMHPDWARSLRDQCQEAGVPFFFKQWGEIAPISAIADHGFGGDTEAAADVYLRNAHASGIVGDEIVVRCGKKAAGRMLDGVLHDAYPGART